MVLREVLEKQMLGLSMETGWELITDGNGDDEVGQNGPSSQRTPQDSARTSVGEWMSLTDALRVRDMARRETEDHTLHSGTQKKRARSRSRSVSSSSRSKRHRSSRQPERVRRSASRSGDRERHERERTSRSRRSRSRSPSPHRYHHRHRHEREDPRSSRSRRY